MSTVNLKLVSSAGVRRLTVAAPLSYGQLLDHICTLYRLADSAGVNVTYVDEDNDTIVITSDAELDEAVRVLGAASTSSVVRLAVAWDQAAPVDTDSVSQDTPTFTPPPTPPPTLPPAPTWKEIAQDAKSLAQDAIVVLKESPVAERATSLAQETRQRLRNDAVLWRTLYAPRVMGFVRVIFRILFFTFLLSFFGFPCRLFFLPVLVVLFFVTRHKRHTSRFWGAVHANAGRTIVFGLIAYTLLPCKLWCLVFVIALAKMSRKWSEAFECGKEARCKRKGERAGCVYF